MLTKIRIIRPGREMQTREVDLPVRPKYETLYRIIFPLLDRRPFEHVNVLFDGRFVDMFVDYLGEIHGLPRNEEATKIYRTNWLCRHPDAEPESLHAIYGPAVLFERKVSF